MITADATVLIALAKMRRLSLLRQLYGQVVIGEIVKTEVVDQGKSIAALGVEQVESAIDEGWVKIVQLNPKEHKAMRRVLSRSGLDPGEAESLALAQSRKLQVILDDKEARAFAETLGLKYLGTAAVLLQAFVEKRVTLEEMEEMVQDLSRILWLSPGVVAEILKRAKEGRK